MRKITMTFIICLLTVSLMPSNTIAEAVGMVTGSKTGTYFRFGNDIAKFAADEGLKIDVKTSDGSVDNIKRLNSLENAAFAIVQSDVLEYLMHSKDPELQRSTKRLRAIFPFYIEEVHLLARKSIKSFRDLNGKRVVLGDKKSGSHMTAKNLFRMMGVKTQQDPKKKYINLPPKKAILAVLLGKADAMIYVAGKPTQIFIHMGEIRENLEHRHLLEEVHFLRLDDSRMTDAYIESSIGPGDYDWVREEIPTIAVRAVLVCFDFSARSTPYYDKRCSQLGTLGSTIRNNIKQLKQTGHPKWGEVDLSMNIPSWYKDTCSQKNQPGHYARPNTSETLEDRLDCELDGNCWRNGRCVTCP